MSVSLEAIKLNHNPNSFTTDAMNIRKNFTTAVPVPEWVKGTSVNPEDSPACYAMAETQGNTLTIQARLQNSTGAGTVQVRAIDPTTNPPGGSGCSGAIAKFIFNLTKALVGNPLGEVDERSITFNGAGDSGYQTFNLSNVTIWQKGVSARITEWQWQYRANSGAPWQNIEVSKHKIYTVIQEPTAPWSMAPGNTSNPWTDALDYACNWGFSTKTIDDAASGVTQSVFNLGPSIITYDCPGGGASHYSWPNFNCTKFIERLQGGAGLGEYVNCSDCATFTSSFSNLLGADLWQSRMGWSFDLNPLLAIGSNVWQTACGWGGFSYHEVAWKGACGADENVFDACLKVDGDANPTAPPHTPLLVANIKFGDCTTMNYRLRLSPPTPTGCVKCAPQPQTRTRRALI